MPKSTLSEADQAAATKPVTAVDPTDRYYLAEEQVLRPPGGVNIAYWQSGKLIRAVAGYPYTLKCGVAYSLAEIKAASKVVVDGN